LGIRRASSRRLQRRSPDGSRRKLSRPSSARLPGEASSEVWRQAPRSTLLPVGIPFVSRRLSVTRRAVTNSYRRESGSEPMAATFRPSRSDRTCLYRSHSVIAVLRDQPTFLLVDQPGPAGNRYVVDRKLSRYKSLNEATGATACLAYFAIQLHECTLSFAETSPIHPTRAACSSGGVAMALVHHY
jgi:hypothetical protein